MVEKIGPEFGEYGLELLKLLVENISLPPAVEEALDKRSSMGILGNLNQYSQFQAANAMEAAANNPNGTASGGIGMGMGFAMANQMGQAMSNNQQNQQSQAPAAGGPPPVPPAISYFIALNGQQTGPFDMAALKQKALSGELTKDSLVWKNGMAAWSAAGTVTEISSLFGQVPPPLPPQ